MFTEDLKRELKVRGLTAYHVNVSLNYLEDLKRELKEPSTPGGGAKPEALGLLEDLKRELKDC